MHASTSSQILDSALDAIGNTPLIRLDRLAQERASNAICVLGKVEFLSAGGSVKDRIAKAMVLAAEKDGKLIPGKSVVIEPTSGNTGIGLAMTCAIKGYPVIITMPNKMSQVCLPAVLTIPIVLISNTRHRGHCAHRKEKEALLRALGAEVIRTPDEEPWDSPRSHIGVAKRLQREIPYGVILDQYGNVNNPLAHEYTTGPEIISAITSTVSTPTKPSSLKVDAFVAGAGTGGTITGVSRALKKDHNPQCIVVGVDPIGSVLALPEYLNDESPKPYVVEGIGYDFVPQVLSRDPSDVDHWVKSSDNDAFRAVQRLMVTEGLLVGGSSGSALSGALAWLKTDRGQKVAQTEGLNVVVLLPDGIRNYMSKEWFLDFALRPGTSRIPQTASDTVNRCN
ncbi:pyridoxal phosphate-dependent enzyme beta subunit [Pisolithus thermaeus]|nr:pyridoxal phosphate-dependent enzyme beta subunit [Pisolithus thermaeus]